MPLISVIIPVYKVEAYLRDCVDSVLAQGFSDYEIILVDDGSPDNCGSICDDYARQDARIRVVHQQNGGLSAARNTGLAASTGSFVTFLDSDDMLHPQALEFLFCAQQQTHASLVLGMYTRDAEPCFAQPYSLSSVSVELIDWIEACSRMTCIKNNTETIPEEERKPYIVSWAKLFRRDLLWQDPFPLGRKHEDEFTTYRFYFAAKSIAVLPIPIYFYRDNPAGIIATRDSKAVRDRIDALIERSEYFREQGLQHLSELTAGKLSWLSTEYAILCKSEHITNDLPMELRVPVPLALHRMKHNTSHVRFISYLSMTYPCIGKLYRFFYRK